MAYYFDIDLKSFFNDSIKNPNFFSKKLKSPNWDSVSFYDLEKLTAKQYLILRFLVKESKLELFDFYSKNLLAPFGKRYTGDELQKLGEKLKDKPSFSIPKKVIIDFINSVKTDEDSRIVFSFGMEDEVLSLFLDIKKLSDGKSIIGVKEIKNSSLQNPLNEVEKKKAYLDSVTESNKKHREGITHVINSQESNKKSELGFLDFLNQFVSEDTLYIYEGVGKVVSKNGNFKKLYFSFNSKLSFTKTEVLYNRNGTCCPPED